MCLVCPAFVYCHWTLLLLLEAWILEGLICLEQLLRIPMGENCQISPLETGLKGLELHTNGAHEVSEFPTCSSILPEPRFNKLLCLRSRFFYIFLHFSLYLRVAFLVRPSLREHRLFATGTLVVLEYIWLRTNEKSLRTNEKSKWRSFPWVFLGVRVFDPASPYG